MAACEQRTGMVVNYGGVRARYREAPRTTLRMVESFAEAWEEDRRRHAVMGGTDVAMLRNVMALTILTAVVVVTRGIVVTARTMTSNDDDRTSPTSTHRPSAGLPMRSCCAYMSACGCAEWCKISSRDHHGVTGETRPGTTHGERKQKSRAAKSRI